MLVNDDAKNRQRDGETKIPNRVGRKAVARTQTAPFYTPLARSVGARAQVAL
jgi:hypothetical protein